jgi:hypothetical protein
MTLGAKAMSSVDPSIHPTVPHQASDIPLPSQGSGYDAAFEAKVLAITSEYFPGPYEIEETFDPQEPEHRWRVIVVQHVGSIQDIQTAKQAWRERILNEFAPEDALRYTLLALPQAE